MNYIGKMARVRSAFEGYDLPTGLPEGAVARITAFEVGQFEVEYHGRKFKVPMMCVENLHQLWN